MFVKIKLFGQKSKYWSEIEICVKDGNLGQKQKYWPKIEMLVKNQTLGQKS